MHKTVIESAPASAPGTVVGGYHTHVLSNLPEDTDVLLVLTRTPRVPETVAAGPYMFTINIDGRISVADSPVSLSMPPGKLEDLQNLHSLVVVLEREVESVQTQA